MNRCQVRLIYMKNMVNNENPVLYKLDDSEITDMLLSLVCCHSHNVFVKAAFLFSLTVPRP
jgi:hypothetical protein